MAQALKEKLASVGITTFPNRIEDSIWSDIRTAVNPPLSIQELIVLKNDLYPAATSTIEPSSKKRKFSAYLAQNQHPLNTESNVVDVNLIEGVFPLKKKSNSKDTGDILGDEILSCQTKPYMIRKNTAYMWKNMDDALKKFNDDSTDYVDFSGPPGCGKSSLVWCWVLHHIQQNSNFKALLIRLNPVRGTFIVSSFRKGENQTDQLEIKGEDYDISYLSTYLRDVNFLNVKNQILVVDGLQNSEVDSVKSFVAKAIDGRIFVICVSSQQVYLFPTHKEVYYKKISIAAEPWTLAEYLSFAKNCPNFCVEFKFAFGFTDQEEVTEDYIEELVDQKFFYAGKCARTMFERSTEEAIEDIEENILRISDYSAALKGNVGNTSSLAINSIFSYGGIVSKFATLKILEKSDNYILFLQQAVVQFKDNGSMLGWLFESEVLMKLKKDKAVRLISRANETTARIVEFDGCKIFEFNNKEDVPQWLNNEDNRKILLSGKTVIMIPRSPRQGFFDFFTLSLSGSSCIDEATDSENRHIELNQNSYNVTVAKSHSLKWNLLRKFNSFCFNQDTKTSIKSVCHSVVLSHDEIFSWEDGIGLPREEGEIVFTLNNLHYKMEGAIVGA